MLFKNIYIYVFARWRVHSIVCLPRVPAFSCFSHTVRSRRLTIRQSPPPIRSHSPYPTLIPHSHSDPVSRVSLILIGQRSSIFRRVSKLLLGLNCSRFSFALVSALGGGKGGGGAHAQADVWGVFLFFCRVLAVFCLFKHLVCPSSLWRALLASAWLPCDLDSPIKRFG